MMDIERDKAREIWLKDKQHFLHPWTHFESFKKAGSLVIESGAGCYVHDINGNRYLDGIGGLWCVNVGYGREEIIEAIAHQARDLAFYNPFTDTTNIPASLLAERLTNLAPENIDHVFFSLGGSTAIDTAFRLIQFYQNCRGKPEKRHMISRREAYHGSTYIAMSLGGKKGDRVPEFEYKTDTIHHISCPNLYRRPNHMSEVQFCDSLVQEFETKIAEIGPQNVAAFFAEPIMGAGGVIVPPEGYLARLWEICRTNDILFVADEVVTAFGRLGEIFASQSVFGIKPDIITCAKGLTSGYQPLGATLLSKEIYDTISSDNPDRVFAHGFTYSGHPVACAAALENIDILEREKICQYVRDDAGPYFIEKLSELKDLPIVGDVRGMHFMACIENVADKETKALFPDSVDVGKMISDHAEKLGLIVRPIGHLNILSPPLVMTREQIDFAVDALRESILRTVENLSKSGDYSSKAYV